MAANLLDLTRNFSLYTIPAAWIISLAPHVYATGLGGKQFDNKNPRAYIQSLEKSQALDNATKGKISRAENAQMNGFENVGLFAAAVVAGNIANLDNSTLNFWSGGYLVSRVVYTYVYINNTSDTMANARSGIFLAGIGAIFTLFIKSGNALRNRL